MIGKSTYVMVTIVNIYPTSHIYLIGGFEYGARVDLVTSCYLAGRQV